MLNEVRIFGDAVKDVDVDARNVIAALTVCMDPKFEFKIMTNLTSLRSTQFQGSGVDLYIIF